MWNKVTAHCVHLQFHFVADREHSLLPFGGRVGDSCTGMWLAVCCENYTDRTKAICGQNVTICQNVMIYKTVQYHSHVTADHRWVNQVSNLSDLTENTTCSKDHSVNMNSSDLTKNTMCSIRKTTWLIWTVQISQKTQSAWITETIQLMFYGERSTMYCKNHIEYTNTQCGQHANP
jgi:hypothetical protein